MKTHISFSNTNIKLIETTLPVVKLTKSKNGETGTATFVFIEPNIFKQYKLKNYIIDGMHLIWSDKIISTTDINIIFKEGKPFLLKSLLIVKNSTEWFDFLNFMTSYSKETGLLFSYNSSFS